MTETFAAFLKGHPSRCLPPPPSCQLPTQLLSSPAGSNLSKEMWGKVREVTRHLHLGIRSGSVTELLQLNKLWLCRVRLLCVCLQPSPSVGRGGRAQPQPCLCSPSSGGLGLGCGGSKERGGSSPVAAWPSTRQAPSHHKPHRAAGQHQVAAARSWGLWGACAPMPPALGWEATPCIKPSLPPHRDTQLLRKPLSPWAALPMTCPLPGPHNHQNHVQICVIYDWILQCHLQASVTVLGDCVPCGSFKQCICASSLSTCLRVGGFQK